MIINRQIDKKNDGNKWIFLYFRGKILTYICIRSKILIQLTAIARKNDHQLY